MNSLGQILHLNGFSVWKGREIALEIALDYLKAHCSWWARLYRVGNLMFSEAIWTAKWFATDLAPVLLLLEIGQKLQTVSRVYFSELLQPSWRLNVKVWNRRVQNRYEPRGYPDDVLVGCIPSGIAPCKLCKRMAFLPKRFGLEAPIRTQAHLQDVQVRQRAISLPCELSREWPHFLCAEKFDRKKRTCNGLHSAERRAVRLKRIGR